MMDVITKPDPGPSREYHFPSFDEETLPGGTRLVVAAAPKLPIITILVVFDAGAAEDPAGKEGIARLTARALSEGTSKWDGAELAEKFEQMGTSLDTGADWDSAIARVTVLPGNLAAALTLLGEVLADPAFPEREVERLKSERIAELLQLETEPRGLADERFPAFLYRESSRYARSQGGSAESVRSLTRSEIDAFYRSRYTAGRTTVIVAGDVKKADVRTLVTPLATALPRGSVARLHAADIPAPASRAIHLITKDGAPQSEIRVGHAGLPRKHPDFFPVLVMNAILGGLFGSRINLNLREKHGYTYGASSSYDWRRGAGPFEISTAVQSDVTAAALREIFAEVERMRSEEVTLEELSLATSYLEGVFPIRFETTSAIASALANLIIYDLPRSYYDEYRKEISRVTAATVLKAARDHIHPEELQTVIVGDTGQIREGLTSVGAGNISVAPAK
ncbi:MAG: insulinase family protein [Gemmatimonadaceae bacterium]|nr:insulinase family protein [Gemmatimonadaceae bacterium]